jgi:branched-chain amino acid transport system substrate-binding protein
VGCPYIFVSGGLLKFLFSTTKQEPADVAARSIGSGARTLVKVIAVGLCFAAVSARSDTVKVAFIDPFTGPFATISNRTLHSFGVSEEIVRMQERSEHRIELVPFDNKGDAGETQAQLKAAISQGYRYVTQGLGMGGSLALLEAVEKHNAKNPGHEVVYMGWSSTDPELTNSKCSFWHFRMDAHSDMKIEAYTTYLSFMTRDRVIKKIYLLNPDFAIGQQVSKTAKEYFKRKRSDLAIVGDDLHPLGQVKDFSSYIAKIKESGADSVLTSSFGTDLALLLQAANKANLSAHFYTLYAQSLGVPSAMGAAAAGRVTLLSNFHANIEGFPANEVVEALHKQYDEDFTSFNTFSMLSLMHKAFRQAKSTDPVKVAYAMEGMRYKGLTGDFEMRKNDHQMQQPLFISTWTKINGVDVKYDQEKTGYGWKTVYKLPPYVASQPTTCQMSRPGPAGRKQ